MKPEPKDVPALLLVAAVLVLTSCADGPSGIGGRAATATNGRIAFSDRMHGRQQLLTIRADGSERRQLTFDGDSGLPSWFPDGRRMLFTSIREDSAGGGLRPGAWVMAADGSDQREILPYAIAADVSPEGNRIAFVSAQRGGIWTADLDGTSLRQLTYPASGASQIHPTWSWEGTRIAYVEVEPDPSSPAGFHPEVWVMNADGTGKRLLTVADPDNLDASGRFINTAHDANAPDWSPTDDRIAFWSGEEGSHGQVWVINADGTGRRQLTEAPLPSHNDDPAWSADGKHILFSTDRGGVHELWVMGADGLGERPITTATAVPLPGDAAWQPVVSASDTASSSRAPSPTSSTRSRSTDFSIGGLVSRRRAMERPRAAPTSNRGFRLDPSLTTKVDKSWPAVLAKLAK